MIKFPHCPKIYFTAGLFKLGFNQHQDVASSSSVSQVSLDPGWFILYVLDDRKVFPTLMYLIVSFFTLKSLIHLEFILLCLVRQGSDFEFLQMAIWVFQHILLRSPSFPIN